MMIQKRQSWWIGFCLLASSALVQAAPVAYWRHEEGAPGTLIPDGPNTVLDATGNGNHMQTFASANAPFTSATYTSLVSPLALRSGLTNIRSLDFGPGGDDSANNDDNFTDNKPIQTELFNALTVELAFNMDSVGPGQFQALVGKDGKPLAASPVPPFKVLVRGDDFPDAIPNQLFIEWIDGDGDIHFVSSGRTVSTGTWNHVAFVLTPSTADLWVAGEGTPYALLDSISGADFAGASGEVLNNVPTSWTVGRGMFNGNVTDWSDAKIDEVRVSNTALSPGEFLFRAVPEPSTCVLSLLAVTGVACSSTRRRTTFGIGDHQRLSGA
jgi:hypothetical protein